MRDKTRYLKFRVHADEKITLSQIVEKFWRILTEYIGIKDLARADPWIIANKFDEDAQTGVIRGKKEYVDDVRASLALIDSMDGKTCFVSVEKISGSINNLD